jgi:diguanylate cyclase (GGDEF)-like protein
MEYVIKAFHTLSKMDSPFRVILGILLLGVVGIFDYFTGTELSFSLFYIFPIAMITWGTSWKFGILTAVASTGVWLLVDVSAGAEYSHPAIQYWNAIVRFSFFLLVVLIINLRRGLEREMSMARTDFVTGAVNTRYFHDLLQAEIDRSSRYSHPLTVAYIDVDNFKAINDTFGHTLGDQILRTIAGNMQQNLRSTDIVARVGGDEFMILLPETGSNAAQTAITKMQMKLLEGMKMGDWSITFSIGVITFITIPKSVDEAFEVADRMMYTVKTNGKNNVSYAIQE